MCSKPYSDVRFFLPVRQLLGDGFRGGDFGVNGYGLTLIR